MDFKERSKNFLKRFRAKVSRNGKKIQDSDKNTSISESSSDASF